MMILFTAILAGAFCALVALGVDVFLSGFVGYGVAMIVMITGGCGSIFAPRVLQRFG